MNDACVSEHQRDDIDAAQRGDQAAFARLYQQHSGWIYGLCWRLAGGDRGLAEDWTQEAFIRAWNKLDRYHAQGSFEGWLRRLTINLALADKRLKRSRFQMESLDQNQEDGYMGAEPAAPSPPWAGADQDLERAIAQLPERARIVLILHSVEGYNHEEISAMTNMAVGSSKAQLHRARKLLQGWFNEQ